MNLKQQFDLERSIKNKQEFEQMTKTAEKTKPTKVAKPEVKLTEEEAMKFLMEQQEKERQEIMKDLNDVLQVKHKGKYKLGIRWEFTLVPNQG